MEDGAASAAQTHSTSRNWVLSLAGIAAGAILITALILRILGARGELWLDELWSLKLIDEVKARHDLFWGLAVDNNHYLNTLYLYLVGADAPALVQRALSILLGTITVAVAGLAARRSGNAGILSAMGFFAISYPMVNYGSEARGYAGLILATLAALLLTEPAAAGSRGDRARLGVVNTAGALFQPIMLSGIVSLIAWAAWINRPSGKPGVRDLLSTVAATARTFSWTVRLLIPFIALVAFSMIHAGGYLVAGAVPFTPEGFVEGYGGLLHLLLGLPEAAPDWLALVLAASAIGLIFLVAPKRDDHRLSLYFIVTVGLPLAMFIARLPNIFFPRYYLASGAVFLLLLSDLFALAWARGGAFRFLALALAVAIAVGNGGEVARLLREGRDQSAAMTEAVAAAGPALVTSDQNVRNRPVIEFFARRLNLPVTYVSSDEICAKNPQWLISSSTQSEMPDVVDTAIFGCKRIYRKRAYFPQWGLSGLPWTVYRADQ